jgi:hypothetical protein
MTIRRICFVAATLVAASAAVAALLPGCGTTPPNLANVSLHGSQKTSVLCMTVNDAFGNPLNPYFPLAQSECAAVPANVAGGPLANHLFALVTQPTAGAIAVVDLTAGGIVDVDKSTPGVDFVPVGASPTDVVVSPLGTRTFVSSADPSRPALYGIDDTQILGSGNQLINGTPLRPALKLTDLPACALPQPPVALAIVPTTAPSGQAGAGDAGTGDAGDGGGSAAPAENGYAVVALLGPSAKGPASIITIDPEALFSTAHGTLAPCTSLGAVLGGAVLSDQGLPASIPASSPWPDGVVYDDAGVSLPVPGCFELGDGGAGDGGQADAGDVGGAASLPFGLPQAPSIAMRSDQPILYVGDSVRPIIHVFDLHDPVHPMEIDPLLATSVVDPTRRISVGAIAVSPPTRDFKTYLYAVDASPGAGGTLMVYDVTDPVASPHTPLIRPHPELTPLAPPDRLSFAGPVATVAFAQHDWPLPSQVDPNHFLQYTGLLCNPNPNAHPDAGVFADNGAYYRVDQALLIQSMDTQGGTIESFPTRLRGIFAFATLSNGNVVTIDVDDWDAPCRRPDPMAIGAVTGPDGVTYDAGVPGSLAVPEPAPGPGDLDPYHAPVAYNAALGDVGAVTLEGFFPVSAPNRARSAFLLRNDPVTGLHIPNMLGAPQLLNSSGAPVAVSLNGTSPLLLPTPLPAGFVDPTYYTNPAEPNPNGRGPYTSPSLGVANDAGIMQTTLGGVLVPASPNTAAVGVRVSFDDPTAHQDQDWSVTYEGALPTVSGIAASIASMQPVTDPDAYQSLLFSAPGARFCARGIEDWNVGQARANRMLGALATAFGGTAPTGINEPTLPTWTADYVEIVDDLLPNTDPYWSETSAVNDCWDGDLADPPASGDAGGDASSGEGLDASFDAGLGSPLAQNRFNFCFQTYGAADTADNFLSRDLPILNANDDWLEVGRFAWDGDTERTTGRTIVGPDLTNPARNRNYLRPIRCCFHHKATFKVRTGGEWVAVGSVVGLLHQVVKESDGTCRPSCDPGNALLNARSFDVPWSSAPACVAPTAPPDIDRDSPLAMRNPMFSYVVWGACGPAPANLNDHTLAARDLSWKFSMRGGFSPLTIPLVSPTIGGGVNPQSMLYIPSLGQMAVVDSEAQGLVLLDLNLVAVSHNYF